MKKNNIIKIIFVVLVILIIWILIYITNNTNKTLKSNILYNAWQWDIIAENLSHIISIATENYEQFDKQKCIDDVNKFIKSKKSFLDYCNSIGCLYVMQEAQMSVDKNWYINPNNLCQWHKDISEEYWK